ncbi:MAG: hypothetical protein JW873_04405 [Candidatus Saganbacteria bacterium]|nr:hypothetical protein [Candidatus Saganbacteria bacterium]
MSHIQRRKGNVRLGAGLVLIVLAVVVLWLNEEARDLAKVARSSPALSADQAVKAADHRLVSITGNLFTPDRIGDPQFLKPGSYLKLARKVQMYGWRRQQQGKGYEKDWLAEPERVNGNPRPAVKPQTWLAPSAMIGAYVIDPQMIELPAPEPLEIAPEQVVLGRGDRQAGKYYIFSGNGTFAKPRIGDLRISFTAVTGSQEVTAFGKKRKDLLAPYITIEYRFYQVFKGNRDQALAQLPAQHTGRLWFLRLFGLLTLWLGLALFRWPVELLLKLYPALQNLKPAWQAFLLALAVWLIAVVIMLYSAVFWSLLFLAVAGYLGLQRLKARK